MGLGVGLCRKKGHECLGSTGSVPWALPGAYRKAVQAYVICTAEAIGMSDKEGLFRLHMDDKAAGAQVLPANRPATKWHQHVVRTAEATGLSGKEGLFQLAASTYRPRRARGSSSAGEEASEGEVTPAKHAERNTCTGLQFVQCICVNRDMPHASSSMLGGLQPWSKCSASGACCGSFAPCTGRIVLRIVLSGCLLPE